MITVNNLNLKLDGKEILHDISFTLEEGYIYGIVGKNGSGKTQLMKCICGFVPFDLGEVIIDNQILGKDIDFIPNSGVIIETPGFLPNYSGYYNLKMLADLNHKIGRLEIEESLRVVGLYDVRKQKVKKYSLGMRQRLGIAQAIMEHPSIIILDEPFNSLDEDGVNQMRDVLVQRKKEGACILISSHNREDIELLCDEVIKLGK